MRRYTLLLVGLALLTLTGCGQASPAQRTHPEPHPSPTTSSGEASDSRAAETRNPATREPASGQVSTSGSDIQIIQWQGFQISLPGNAVFHEEQPSIFINGFPIEIRAKIIYAETSTTGLIEEPVGPIFSIVDFDGSIHDWLELERKNATSMSGNRVDEQTVHKKTIAGLPAIIYQRLVIGTGDMTYAIIDVDKSSKADKDQLLLIAYDASFEPNNLIIANLARTTD